MPGDLVGVRRGTPSQEAPPDILEAPYDGGESGGLLRDIIPGSALGDAGRSDILHHL